VYDESCRRPNGQHQAKDRYVLEQRAQSLPHERIPSIYTRVRPYANGRQLASSAGPASCYSPCLRRSDTMPKLRGARLARQYFERTHTHIQTVRWWACISLFCVLSGNRVSWARWLYRRYGCHWTNRHISRARPSLSPKSKDRVNRSATLR